MVREVVPPLLAVLIAVVGFDAWVSWKDYRAEIVAATPLPAPIEYREPRWNNGAYAEPGEIITITVPSKRTRICAAWIREDWFGPENFHITGHRRPISVFVEPGDWVDFHKQVLIPADVKGQPWVEYMQFVDSECEDENGVVRATERAVIPKIRIPLEG